MRCPSYSTLLEGSVCTVDLTLPRGVWIQISWKDQQLLGERFQRFQTQDGFFRQSGQGSWLHQLVAPAGCIKVGPSHSHSHGECPWKRDNFWENRKNHQNPLDIWVTADWWLHPISKITQLICVGKTGGQMMTQLVSYEISNLMDPVTHISLPTSNSKKWVNLDHFTVLLWFIRDLGYNK